MANQPSDSRFFAGPGRSSTRSGEQPPDKQFSRGLVPIAFAAAALLLLAGVMVFWYAPVDADQGMRQKIFFLHVPLAIITLGGFVAGG